jgi:aspartate racemase
LVIAAYRRATGGGGLPPLLINSIDVHRVLRAAEHDLTALVEYLVEELHRLENAGAALGLMAASTPHVVFDTVAHRMSIPLLSIVEATVQHIKFGRLRRLALFSTRFTMQGGFYQAAFAKDGIGVIVPRADEQAWSHDAYVSELVNGRFLVSTRDRLLEIVRVMALRDCIDGVILAGTELPLLFSDAPAAEVPLLDTAHVHAQAAANRLWRPSPEHE